jgi:hypothetical protein
MARLTDLEGQIADIQAMPFLDQDHAVLACLQVEAKHIRRNLSMEPMRASA